MRQNVTNHFDCNFLLHGYSSNSSEVIPVIVIVALFQAVARPTLAANAMTNGRLACLAPILVYAGMIVFQVTQTQPVALRVIAFFAMGIPALAAVVAWAQWTRPREAHAGS